jgi:hypothetical protein
MDLGVTDSQDGKMIELAEDRKQWPALVTDAFNPRIPLPCKLVHTEYSTLIKPVPFWMKIKECIFHEEEKKVSYLKLCANYRTQVKCDTAK